MSSLHEEHGREAPNVLQGTMKAQVTLPEGFEAQDNGNHYIISKDGKEMHVPLFSAKEVFRALNIFA
jgi:hypothetical protein